MTSTKLERIAAIRDSIAVVEREECRCGEYDEWDKVLLRCVRCERLEDLNEQLREAEGQDV